VHRYVVRAHCCLQVPVRLCSSVFSRLCLACCGGKSRESRCRRDDSACREVAPPPRHNRWRYRYRHAHGLHSLPLAT
jgi:hypothetical protein